MKALKRLKIISRARRVMNIQQTEKNADYKEEYWALRKKYNIKNGITLEPLSDDRKKQFREEVKKLKKKYNINNQSRR